MQILIHTELLDPPGMKSSLEPIESASSVAESESCVPPWCAAGAVALTPSEPASLEHGLHFLARHHRITRPHPALGLRQAALDNAMGLIFWIERIQMRVTDCEMGC